MRWLLVLGLAGSVVATALAASPDPFDLRSAPAAVRRAIFRAEIAVQRGDPQRGCEILTGALTAGHDHPALHYRLGTCLLDLGRAQEAAAHLRTASAALPPTAVSADAQALWCDLGRAEYESHAYVAAAQAFSRGYAIARRRSHAESSATGRTDQSEDLLYFGATAWLLADQPDSALSRLVPLVEDAPDTVPQAWVRALVAAAAQADRPERAAAGVARMLHDHPAQPSAWTLASDLSQVAGHLREAAIRLQIAQWLAPAGDDDRRRLADLYVAAGVPRQAARLYEILWRDARADASLGLLVAGAWMRAHEPDSARTVLRDALAHVEAGADTTAVRILAMLGDLEYGERNWADAAIALRRVTGLAPERAASWLLLGAADLQLGLQVEARAALERAACDSAVAGRARRLLTYMARDAD